MKQSCPGAAFLFAAALMILPSSGMARDEVLFYPTAVRNGTNLLGKAVWKPLLRDKVFYETGAGGPRLQDSRSWTVSSDEPNPGYWRASVKIDTKRTYLAGSWIRFSNAKILLWYFGHDRETGRNQGRRIYLFNGFNECLEPYLSDLTKELISGDCERWRPLYRTVSFDAPLKNDMLHIWQGLYLAAGKVSFSEPFLVDLTDADRSYTIDIAGTRPISGLKVVRAINGDLNWRKTFEKPVCVFSGKTPPEVDALADIEGGGNLLRGHVLVVTYADGGETRVYSPENHIFTERR